MALTSQDDKENQSLKKLPICPPNTTRIIPLEQVYPDRRVLIKSSGDFESLNPYKVNDDRREYFSVLKDPEFSFEEYLEMQPLIITNQLLFTLTQNSGKSVVFIQLSLKIVVILQNSSRYSLGFFLRDAGLANET